MLSVDACARRAKAISLKFQIPLDPLLRWSVENRYEADEIARTKGLVEKLASPPQPVPYRVFVASRALVHVLAAPIDSIPMAVGSSGVAILGLGAASVAARTQRV